VLELGVAEHHREDDARVDLVRVRVRVGY